MPQNQTGDAVATTRTTVGNVPSIKSDVQLSLSGARQLGIAFSGQKEQGANMVKSPGDQRKTSAVRWRSLTVLAGATALVSTMAFSGVSLSSTPEPASSTAVQPAWTVAVSSDPGSGAEVKAGSEVAVTLTVSNTATADLPAGAEVVADLAEPLAHAKLASPDTLSAAGLKVSGTKLTWTAPAVAAKSTAKTHFSLAVADGAEGSTLKI